MHDSVLVGKAIKAKRQELGWKQKELADKLFVTPTAVYNWEKGLFLPKEDIRENLERLLGGGIFMNDTSDYKLKGTLQPLETIKSYSELERAEEMIIENINVDTLFEKTLSAMLRYTLDLILGYEVFYKQKEYEAEPESLCWQGVGYTLGDIYSNEISMFSIKNENRISECNASDNPVAQKMAYIKRLIDAEICARDERALHEQRMETDSDYYYRVGYFGSKAGRNLGNLMPASDSVMMTLYMNGVIQLEQMLLDSWQI